MKHLRTLAVFGACLLCGALSVLGQVDVHSLSNAELIAQAPDAAEGLHWNAATKQTEISPVGVEIGRRILGKKLSDDDWRALLIKSRVICSHPKWPANTPFAIGMAYPLWLTDFHGDVTFTARLKNAKPVSTQQTYGGCGVYNDWVRDVRRYQEVGDLPDGVNEVVFDVQFRKNHGESKPTWSGTVALPVEIVKSRQDALTAVHDKAIDALLHDSIICLVSQNQGKPPAWMMWIEVEPGRTKTQLSPEIRLHFYVALLDGDKHVAQCGPISMDWGTDSQCRTFNVVQGIPEERLRDRSYLSRLTARVTSDPETAFKDLKHSKYWDGELAVPLIELIDRSNARP